MRHSANGKESIEVIDLHSCVLLHEGVNSFVVVYRVPRADGLIGPANILYDLAVMWRTCECGDVCFYRLEQRISVRRHKLIIVNLY